MKEHFFLKLCAVNNAIHQCGLSSAAAAAAATAGCLHALNQQRQLLFQFSTQAACKENEGCSALYTLRLEIVNSGYTNCVTMCVTLYPTQRKFISNIGCHAHFPRKSIIKSFNSICSGHIKDTTLRLLHIIS